MAGKGAKLCGSTVTVVWIVALTWWLALAGAWGDTGRVPAGGEGAEAQQVSRREETSPAELLARAREIVERKPREAAGLAQRAEEVGGQLGDAAAVAEAVFIRADAARVEGEHRTALELYHEARRRFSELGDLMELGRSIRRLGDMYYFLTDFDSALKYYLNALQHFEGLAKQPDPGKAPLHVAHLHAAIGNVLKAMGDIPRAMEYYQRALAEYDRLENPGGVAGCRYNLGVLQEELKQFDAALASYGEAQRAAEALGDQYLLSLALASTGSALRSAGRLAEAEVAIGRALEVCQRMDRRRGIADNLLKLASVRRLQGHLPAALRTAQEGLELAERLEDRRMVADAHRELAEVYDAMGRPMEALVSLRRFQAIDEEVAGVEKSSHVNKLMIAFESARKEQEINSLQAQRRADQRVRWAVTAMLGLALVVIGLLVAGYRLKVQSANAIAAKNAELEEAYARVEELARIDELTQLFNRRGIFEFLQHEVARSRREQSPLALVLGDLDDFKRINDTCGHAVGDAVLRAAAAAIRGSVRATDAVARWGGEEFLAVLPNTGLEGAALVAEKIRAAVAALTVEGARGVGSLTITLGVSVCLDGDLKEALRRADAAVYEGKGAGKDTVRMAPA